MKYDCKKNKPRISRKEFLKKSGLLALGASLAPWAINLACTGKPAEAETTQSTAIQGIPGMCIAKNDYPYDLTRKAVTPIGGMGRFVRNGDRVAIVPNIGWSRTPEQAANTNPGVVKALVEMCFESGAKQVEVFCNPCANPRVTYDMSGIGAAASEAGAYTLYLSGEKDYREMNVPDGIWRKKNLVAKALLDADVFINVPIAKHHGSSRLTMLQKNLMGVIYHRSVLHPNIHRELVALQKVLPADLYVLDCSRILLRNGPTGGNLKDVKKMDQVIAGIDPIAIEAYGATLFELDPLSIGFIKLGEQEGIGTTDWQSTGCVIAH